jgi:hypothetical protein
MIKAVPATWATRAGAATLAAGGAAWMFKAGAILLTGSQPPLALELGQGLCALGVVLLGVWGGRRSALARAAAAAGALALAAGVGASAYALLPGAVHSTGETFVFPYSPLVLIASVGGLVGMSLLGLELWRAPDVPRRWGAVAFAAGLAPLPAAFAAAVHIEWPILLIGAAWAFAALAHWQSVPNPYPAAGEGGR